MPWLSHQSLRILSEFLNNPKGELSGSELIRAAALLSGTVYPILMRFERRGLVSSRWEDGDPSELGRPRKRLYRLTGEGFRVAKSALSELSPGLAPAKVTV
jgi:DNA-binding PadR family transcriptional regulator